MFFEMLQKAVARVSLHLCYVEQYLPNADPLAALVWGTHENDAVRGQFDGSLFLKVAFSEPIRMK